ncbi:MAG: hypothetical protein ACYDA3_01525 [Gaiellaceae bacterium]
MPPLGLLFAFLAACFAGLAVVAAAHNLVVTIASVALSAWFASTAYTVLRRRR